MMEAGGRIRQFLGRTAWERVSLPSVMFYGLLPGQLAERFPPSFLIALRSLRNHVLTLSWLCSFIWRLFADDCSKRSSCPSSDEGGGHNRPGRGL